MKDLKLLKPEVVAEKLEISANTLACWRSMGRGPKFVKIGRFPRYREQDVIDWVNSQARSH